MNSSEPALFCFDVMGIKMCGSHPVYFQFFHKKNTKETVAKSTIQSSIPFPLPAKASPSNLLPFYEKDWKKNKQNIAHHSLLSILAASTQTSITTKNIIKHYWFTFRFITMKDYNKATFKKLSTLNTIHQNRHHLLAQCKPTRMLRVEHK